VVRFVRDRRGYKNDVNGKPGRFGMSGMVGTNVVLGDQETGTSWQQASGEAIEGPLKGRRLTMVTFIHTTWGEWRAEHPHALIMRPHPATKKLRALQTDAGYSVPALPRCDPRRSPPPTLRPDHWYRKG